jgi:hypothetical protein
MKTILTLAALLIAILVLACTASKDNTTQAFSRTVQTAKM